MIDSSGATFRRPAKAGLKLLLVLVSVTVYAAVFFVSMVVMAMALAFGGGYPVLLLALLWFAYFLAECLGWKHLNRLSLTAIVGAATGLLWQLDRLEGTPLGETLKSLPRSWLGWIGVVFYVPFVIVLPASATALSERVRPALAIRAARGVIGRRSPIPRSPR